MTKQQQFLYIVQTVTVANAQNILARPELAEKFWATASASGTGLIAAEAIAASAKIPKAMSATDAADEFCNFMLDNLRSSGDDCPEWFARG